MKHMQSQKEKESDIGILQTHFVNPVENTVKSLQQVQGEQATKVMKIPLSLFQMAVYDSEPSCSKMWTLDPLEENSKTAQNFVEKETQENEQHQTLQLLSFPEQSEGSQRKPKAQRKERKPRDETTKEEDSEKKVFRFVCSRCRRSTPSSKATSTATWRMSHSPAFIDALWSLT